MCGLVYLLLQTRAVPSVLLWELTGRGCGEGAAVPDLETVHVLTIHSERRRRHEWSLPHLRNVPH